MAEKTLMTGVGAAPYSPDLAPSDYHVFGPLKKFLAGQRFISDDDDQWRALLNTVMNLRVP
jgi:hypothetical protein